MVYTDLYISKANNVEIKKKWATDFIFSKNTYRLDQNVEEPGNCISCYLEDGPDITFICEELMHI